MSSDVSSGSPAAAAARDALDWVAEAERRVADQRLYESRMRDPQEERAARHVPSDPDARRFCEFLEATDPTSARTFRRSAYFAEARARVAFLERSSRRSAKPPPVAQRRQRSGTRPRSFRAAARRTKATRAGPSDPDEGDGEGEPSPAFPGLATNSRSTDTKCPPWVLAGFGVDTVGFAYKDPDAVAAMIARARGRMVGSTRARWVGGRLTLPVDGVVVSAHPGARLVTVEGRLGAMVAPHRSGGALVPITRLSAGQQYAERVLAQVAPVSTKTVTLRRLDLAAELWFSDARDGLSFLTACHRGLHLPRLRQVPYHAVGSSRLESVIWQTGVRGGTRLRLYDAGAHHGSIQPGRRLRLERQKRWTGQKAPTVGQTLDLDLAQLYSGPFSRWLTDAPEVVVASPASAIEIVYGEARSGLRTRRSAESLAGQIATLTAAPDLLPPHDRRRKQRAVRQAGLVLDGDLLDASRTVDLRPALVALARRWV